MKKFVKISLLIVAIILIIFLGFTVYYLILTSDAKLDESKINDVKNCISYFDNKNDLMTKETNNVEVIKIEEVPEHVKNSFIAIEDKRFYKHGGVDYRGLSRAMLKNIKNFSFVEGGSTITQQLIKNTHLSNEKTIKRKLIEIKLAKKLEKNYTKDQILEKYLNTIYFGNNCFGISSASKKYFNKMPKDLNVNESATLAGIIKAPSIYSPLSNYDKCLSRRNVVLGQMYNQGYISKKDYEKILDSKIEIAESIEKNYGYEHLLNNEVDKIIGELNLYNKKIDVYTYFDKNIQNNIENLPLNEIKCDKSCAVMSNDSKILGYFSTCGNIKRQVGSTIKPLLVYAPAIEYNVIDSCTKILDEKTDFGNYSPSNYNDKYYGYISAKECLAKSLNVPAVKLLNYVGIDKAKELVNKTNIKLNDNDNTLGVALGDINEGVNLVDLTSSYSIFTCEGFCYEPRCVKEIVDEFGRVVYKDKNEKNKVISNETAYIVGDMMKEAVYSGTAKKLKLESIDVRAKTGTVGFDNGNTDAYTISYTGENIVGVWCGNKDNTIMDNAITGGSFPALLNKSVLEKIYENHTCKSLPSCNTIKEIMIDKISYDENNVIEVAGENTPKRFTLSEIFKSDHVPSVVSNRFVFPKVEIVKTLVNNNEISIELCLTKYAKAYVYKYYDNKKIKLKDITHNDTIIVDNNEVFSEVKYSILPYFDFNDNIVYGEEVFTNIIKPLKNISGLENDRWWDEDY